MQRVIPIFERCDDHHGLCSARRLEAWLHWNEARAAAAAEAWERAAAHASGAGDEHARAEILTWIASSLWFGPTPIAEGIRRCEEIRSEVSGHLDAEALTLRHLAGLHAMNGHFDLARSLLATSNGVFEDLGLTLNAATSHNEALIEMLAGDPAAAETSLRSGFEALKQMGEQAFLSTTAAFLARAVFAQGRVDEAEELAQLSAQLAAPGDLLTQVLWRGVQARVLARRGRLEDAEALAREAVALAGADGLPRLPRRRPRRPGVHPPGRGTDGRGGRSRGSRRLAAPRAKGKSRHSREDPVGSGRPVLASGTNERSARNGGGGMPGGNFDDKLPIGADGTVTAKGPLDKSVTTVNEMCVWVLQRNGADDAIQNNMGMPGMPDSQLKVFNLGTDHARWMFPLKRRDFKHVDFTPGSATAMATAVFFDEHGRQRGFFWSETVELTTGDDETDDC